MKEIEKDKEVQRRRGRNRKAADDSQLNIIFESCDIFGSSTKLYIIRYLLFTEKC
jgi:hypothetical protein